MQPIHIALTTTTTAVQPTDLSQVAAALQKQVTRDFAPIWNVTATVDAFALSEIPAGYWPIIVQDTIDAPGAAGYHQTESDDTPYALVLYGETWSLTASHECLEMLADPFGSQKRTGQSLKAGQGRVDYVVEVCDPCEDSAFAYPVNGVMVSDFYTPAFFDPVAVPQVRYSFTGAITQPFQVLPNGYLSWFASDGMLYQAFADADGGIRLTDGISASGRNGRPLREFVDSLSPDHQRRLSNASRSDAMREAHASARDARGAQGERFRNDIMRRFGKV
jgi:hypothetical protein